MNKDTFKEFVQLYSQRYGQMNTETAKLWYSKLKELDDDKFWECAVELIGERDFPFGWKELHQQ